MKKITAIRAGRGQNKRVNIYLDGEFAFSLEAETAIKEDLKEGIELTTERIGTLKNSDRVTKCLNAAVNLLSYRPRSESELRGRLKQRLFDEVSIESAIVKLKEQGLVDDMAFAQFWKDNRETFSPRSQWLTRVELRRKGVADGTIDQVIAAVDDNEGAYQAATSKARRMDLSDYQGFRRRLGGYLKRRGFSYGVINSTVERVWQEQRELGEIELV